MKIRLNLVVSLLTWPLMSFVYLSAFANPLLENHPAPHNQFGEEFLLFDWMQTSANQVFEHDQRLGHLGISEDVLGKASTNRRRTDVPNADQYLADENLSLNKPQEGESQESMGGLVDAAQRIIFRVKPDNN